MAAVLLGDSKGDGRPADPAATVPTGGSSREQHLPNQSASELHLTAEPKWVP
jgi:hypothetical protein